MPEQRTFGGFEQHQRRFERVPRDVYADKPECLHAHELRERVRAHPQFKVDLGLAGFMSWLDEANTDVVVNNPLAPWTYRTLGHRDDSKADGDAEEAGV